VNVNMNMNLSGDPLHQHGLHGLTGDGSGGISIVDTTDDDEGTADDHDHNNNDVIGRMHHQHQQHHQGDPDDDDDDVDDGNESDVAFAAHEAAQALHDNDEDDVNAHDVDIVGDEEDDGNDEDDQQSSLVAGMEDDPSAVHASLLLGPTPPPPPVYVCCRICGRGDEDGRPLLRFIPVEHCPAAAEASPSVQTFSQDICLHIFCGKTASILPSVAKPELEILTKAGLKNKHGIGPEVNAALARTRCAVLATASLMMQTGLANNNNSINNNSATTQQQQQQHHMQQLQQLPGKEKQFYLVREFEAHFGRHSTHAHYLHAGIGGANARFRECGLCRLFFRRYRHIAHAGGRYNVGSHGRYQSRGQ